ncbi:MAG TPA: hypothetical protein VGD10_11025 [Allosphingosinicella sp.]|uniref:hypothetical protein n=1 Tax=Allosphingosinicella sp. TaxID=2823234 RepID=UPI002ED967E9
MRTIFDANTAPIIIALLIGLVIGWWIFRRVRTADGRDVAAPPQALEQERPVPEAPAAPTPLRRDTPEGNSLADQGAAATTDVAGEVLGVQVHSELPGASGPPDNLSIMKGVGPKFVTQLNANGITRFDQLARLSDNEVAMLDEKMGPFRGRLARDRVIEQAAYLARNDRDGFEAKFGKLGSGA